MTPDTLSVCVIALNEAAYLPRLLDDLLAQTYPQEKTEIVLVDSGSRDETPSIMARFRREHLGQFRDIRLGTNPRGIQAAGWNRAITLSTGEIIVRLDAHARIPADFLEKSMAAIGRGEAVAGGPCRYICDGAGFWQRTLLQAENSLFGSSPGKSRRKVRRQAVKTVSHGAYRREVFDSVGLFDETLRRTEDNELHYRLRKAGYSILLDPEITSSQYLRSTLRGLLGQKYANGFWIGRTLWVCPGCISLHHLAPFGFVLGIAATTVLALAGFPAAAQLLWLAYGLFCLVFSLAGIRELGAAALVLPGLFLLIHLCYGIGTAQGLWQGLWRAKP